MQSSLFAVGLVVLSAVPVLAVDEFPSWAKEAAAVAAPKYDGKVPAVVLLDEQRLTIDDAGRRICTTRHAIRILNREGRRTAIAREEYVTGTGKVRDLRAWMLAPGGEVKKYGKDRTLDIAYSENDVYNEYRMRLINAESDADPGAVFAYEAVSEDRSIFTQWAWSFQGRLPVLVSRFALTLPGGWRSEAVSFNSAPIQPVVSENTSTWELRNLPFIEDEPASPGVSSIVPRLGVSFFPAAGAKNAGPSFASWGDVARFQSDLAETQQTTTEALVSKAKSLAGTEGSELERVGRVTKFVQAINYIAVQTNVGRGGGYRPHAAADVFAKAYGDCKDKANLLRTMLRAVGVESYLVAVHSGDRTHAREQWPSPWQFDHMIVAIRVGADTKTPAVLESSPFGRLLIFDPTDEVTPAGYLPVHLQDSYALLIAPEKGGLIKLPLAPPAANRVERETTVALDATGSIRAMVAEKRFGAAATVAHRQFVLRSREDYLKSVERMVSHTVTGAKVSKVEPAGQPAGEFRLGLEFEGGMYAQIMQGRLMMFRPAVLAGGTRYDFAADKRAHPVVLDAEAFRETVKATLPQEFEMDEMPDAVTLKTPFGAYRATYTLKGRELTFTRELEVNGVTVPAANYLEVRKFFAAVYGSEQAPAVLVKK